MPSRSPRGEPGDRTRSADAVAEAFQHLDVGELHREEQERRLPSASSRLL
jgi:hypothetical protein